jgi:hypothetical protein
MDYPEKLENRGFNSLPLKLDIIPVKRCAHPSTADGTGFSFIKPFLERRL